MNRTSGVLIYFLLFGSLRACEDGTDNVVTIHNLLDEAKVQFYNVSVLTYDLKKKPVCSKQGPSIKFPGFVKIAGGEIKVVDSLVSENVKVYFTAEHNSFFVGQVCLNGKSENSFVSDDQCQTTLCGLVGREICDQVNKKQTVDAGTLFDDYFPLPESSIAELGGEWRLEVKLRVANEEVGHIRLGRTNEWIQILVDGGAHNEL